MHWYTVACTRYLIRYLWVHSTSTALVVLCVGDTLQKETTFVMQLFANFPNLTLGNMFFRGQFSLGTAQKLILGLSVVWCCCCWVTWLLFSLIFKDLFRAKFFRAATWTNELNGSTVLVFASLCRCCCNWRLAGACVQEWWERRSLSVSECQVLSGSSS